jgi:hypothetical protein
VKSQSNGGFVHEYDNDIDCLTELIDLEKILKRNEMMNLFF